MIEFDKIKRGKMSVNVVPVRVVKSSLTRLICCASLLSTIVDKMSKDGAQTANVMRVVGACDLLEAIIQDTVDETNATMRPQKEAIT